VKAWVNKKSRFKNRVAGQNTSAEKMIHVYLVCHIDLFMFYENFQEKKFQQK